MQRFWTERWRYGVYLTEQARDQAYQKTWVASFEDGHLSWWPLTIARNNLDSRWLSPISGEVAVGLLSDLYACCGPSLGCQRVV